MELLLTQKSIEITPDLLLKLSLKFSDIIRKVHTRIDERRAETLFKSKIENLYKYTQKGFFHIFLYLKKCRDVKLIVGSKKYELHQIIVDPILKLLGNEVFFIFQENQYTLIENNLTNSMNLYSINLVDCFNELIAFIYTHEISTEDLILLFCVIQLVKLLSSHENGKIQIDEWIIGSFYNKIFSTLSKYILQSNEVSPDELIKLFEVSNSTKDKTIWYIVFIIF